MADDDFDSEHSAGEPASAANAAATSGKRKHDQQDDLQRQRSSKRAAKRKKRSAKKAAEATDHFDDVDEELSINRATARMDPSLVADFIARQTKRFETDLSLIELEDRRIPATAFADTSGWKGIRMLENLPSFLEKQSGKSRKDMSESPSDTKGAPHTLIVTAAGLRAADITRALRIYQTKNIIVAKLFAKHIKLKDAIEFSSNTRMNIGVGTPQRLLDLVTHGALSLDSLTHIVVDASHVNEKRRGILDTRETLTPLTQLLSRPQLRQRYNDGETRAIVF